RWWNAPEVPSLLTLDSGGTPGLLTTTSTRNMTPFLRARAAAPTTNHPASDTPIILRVLAGWKVRAGCVDATTGFHTEGEEVQCPSSYEALTLIAIGAAEAV